ncbi:MAG: hypothetical protein ABI595_13155 [Actinomycetota bacterium]
MARPLSVESSVGTIQVYLDRSSALAVLLDESGEAVSETPGTIGNPSQLAQLIADAVEIPMAEAQELTISLVDMARSKGRRWRWLAAG